MENTNSYERFLERYRAGEVPWDDELPPPELMELVEDVPAGRALDLGCGYGRASIFMAQEGWQVDGVDFIPEAIVEANARAAAAGVAGRTHFHVSSVSELGFLHGPYDLALDVGCLHSLAEPGLQAYRDELARLLRPGAVYLLFARLAEENGEEEGPRGIEESAVRALFQEGFMLEQMERNVTQMAEKPAWPSAWFWFRRR